MIVSDSRRLCFAGVPGALRKNLGASAEHEGISVFAWQEDDPIDAIPENPVTAAIERYFR